MNRTVKGLLRACTVTASLVALAASPLAATAQETPGRSAEITPADINGGTFSTLPENGGVTLLGEADGTPAGAVKWFQNRIGSTAYQGYCEKAVENAYGTGGVWASANAHWNGASPKHHGNHNPPLGAFVYWNIGAYGHVGISDGNGGFYATSVGGRIGRVTKGGGGYNYFKNYRGWTPAAVPRR